MEAILLRKKRSDFFNKCKNLFIYSDFFPLFTGFVAFFCWMTNTTLIGLALFVAIGCYLFVSQEDTLPIIPILICVITSFRSLSVAQSPLAYAILAPAVVCIIVHVVKYKLTPNLGKLFFPLIAVSIALFSGGSFSYYISDYARGLLTIISIGPVLIVVYLFFLNYIRPPEEICLKTYFCKCIVITTVFACIECTYVLYNQEILKNTVFANNELGWGNINTVGTLVLLSVPLCFYLMTKTDRVIEWFTIVLFFTVFSFILDSSLVLLFLLASIIFLVFYTYRIINNEKKLLYKNLVFISFSVGIAVVLITLANDADWFFKKFETLSANNGRDFLYGEALALFKKYPLLGVGFGYYNDDFTFINSAYNFNNLRIYNFHSTFWQILASTGLVGIAAYVYYFAQRIKTLTAKDSRYCKFAFASFLAFFCHGFFDTCEFNMIPLLITLTLIMIVAEVDAKTPKRKSLFPQLCPTYTESSI